MLTPDNIPFMANAVLNPGAAEVDGEVVLLQRIEDKNEVYPKSVWPAVATASMAGGPPNIRCWSRISPNTRMKNGAVKTH